MKTRHCLCFPSFILIFLLHCGELLISKSDALDALSVCSSVARHCWSGRLWLCSTLEGGFILAKRRCPAAWQRANVLKCALRLLLPPDTIAFPTTLNHIKYLGSVFLVPLPPQQWIQQFAFEWNTLVMRRRWRPLQILMRMLLCVLRDSKQTQSIKVNRRRKAGSALLYWV